MDKNFFSGLTAELLIKAVTSTDWYSVELIALIDAIEEITGKRPRAEVTLESLYLNREQTELMFARASEKLGGRRRKWQPDLMYLKSHTLDDVASHYFDEA